MFKVAWALRAKLGVCGAQTRLVGREELHPTFTGRARLGRSTKYAAGKETHGK